MKYFFLVLFFLFLIPGYAYALESVTIQGTRFYAGGNPYFPSTNFLTNNAPFTFTHVYFSNDISDSERINMLTALKNEGHNAIFLYTINEGDYGSRVVTPYQSGIISDGGAFNNTKIAFWRSEMQDMLSMGLRPIIWLFPDDSPSIHNTSTTELKRYIQKMVQSFDDLPIMWVLALEVDEYWNKTKSDDLGTYLQSIANNPVGLHQLQNQTSYITSSWVDFAVYQYGFGHAWSTIYNDTLNRKASFTKPFFAAEYDLQGGDFALERGLAAAFANAAGVGNGAPEGLAAFIESLPDNMTPSRNGNILTLSQNTVIATADMTTLQFSKNTQTSPTPSSPATTPTPTLIAPSSTPTPTRTPTQLIISNLTNSSDTIYEVVYNGLNDNTIQYIDRPYTFSSVPQEFIGLTYIKTANSDKVALPDTNNFVTFSVNKPVTIYIAHDDRISPKPNWLMSFTNTNLAVRNSDTSSPTYSMYSKEYSTGIITLGSNTSIVSDVSMYSIGINDQTSIMGNIVPPHNIVNIFDYNAVVNDFGLTGTNLRSDIVPNNSVDLFDYNRVVTNFGT